MAATVLNSRRAMEVSARSHAELARRLDALEAKCDAQFKVVFDAIRKLMEPPARGRPRIGFRPEMRAAPPDVA